MENWMENQDPNFLALMNSHVPSENAASHVSPDQSASSFGRARAQPTAATPGNSLGYARAPGRVFPVPHNIPAPPATPQPSAYASQGVEELEPARITSDIVTAPANPYTSHSFNAAPESSRPTPPNSVPMSDKEKERRKSLAIALKRRWDSGQMNHVHRKRLETMRRRKEAEAEEARKGMEAAREAVRRQADLVGPSGPSGHSGHQRNSSIVNENLKRLFSDAEPSMQQAPSHSGSGRGVFGEHAPSEQESSSPLSEEEAGATNPEEATQPYADYPEDEIIPQDMGEDDGEWQGSDESETTESEDESTPPIEKDDIEGIGPPATTETRQVFYTTASGRSYFTFKGPNQPFTLSHGALIPDGYQISSAIPEYPWICPFDHQGGLFHDCQDGTLSVRGTYEEGDEWDLLRIGDNPNPAKNQKRPALVISRGPPDSRDISPVAPMIPGHFPEGYRPPPPPVAQQKIRNEEDELLVTMLAKPSPLKALGNPQADGVALWHYIQPVLTIHKGPDFPIKGWVPGVLSLPRVRELGWNVPWVSTNPFLDSKPRDVTALLMYLTGEVAPEPCKKCKDGKGPFKQCVMMAREAEPGPLRAVFSCANCFYHYGQTYCSHKGWGEKRGIIISELMMKSDPESLSMTMDELLYRESIRLGGKPKVATPEASTAINNAPNNNAGAATSGASAASAAPAAPPTGTIPQIAQSAEEEAVDEASSAMDMDNGLGELVEMAGEDPVEEVSAEPPRDRPNPVWERYGYKAIKMAEPGRRYTQWPDDVTGELATSGGTLLPAGYRLDTTIPDRPWICPIRTCRQLFPKRNALGYHFLRAHFATLLNDNGDTTFTITGVYIQEKQKYVARGGKLTIPAFPIVVSQNPSPIDKLPEPRLPNYLMPRGVPADQGGLWQYVAPYLVSTNAIPEIGCVKELLELPRVRDIGFCNPSKPFFEKTPRDVAAMVIHLTGDTAPEPCTRCHDNKGVFNGCVVISTKAYADARSRYVSCSNCLYHGNQTYCSLKEFVLDREQPPFTRHHWAGGRDVTEPARATGQIPPVTRAARKSLTGKSLETSGSDLRIQHYQGSSLAGSETPIPAPSGASLSRSVSAMSQLRNTPNSLPKISPVPLPPTAQYAASQPPTPGSSQAPKRRGRPPKDRHAQQPTSALITAGTVQPAETLEMENWEVAPGRIRESSSGQPDNIAFSKAFLSTNQVVNVCDDVSFRVYTIHSGGTWRIEADENKTRLCSIASGKLRIKAGTEPEFIIGQHGMFKVKPGVACEVKNWMYVDAIVHVTVLEGFT
ncbi:hypothetical protein OQA88_11092 [Cercophora sp. LCS_1]